MKSCAITLNEKILDNTKYTVDFRNRILRCDLDNVVYDLGHINGWNFIIGNNCNLTCGRGCNIEGGSNNIINSSADTMVYMGKNSKVETGGISILYLGSNSEVRAGLGGIFYLGDNCQLDTYYDYKKIVYSRNLNLTIRRIGSSTTKVLSCDFKETL